MHNLMIAPIPPPDGVLFAIHTRLNKPRVLWWGGEERGWVENPYQNQAKLYKKSEAQEEIERGEIQKWLPPEYR